MPWESHEPAPFVSRIRRGASAIQIVRLSRSRSKTQPSLHPAFLRLRAIIFQYGNRFISPFFNGEFGNSRDASAYADGAKSKFPKRAARTLRLTNSLRMAT